MSESDAAYQQGYTRGTQRGREAERRDVVAMLRMLAGTGKLADCKFLADSFERGEHIGASGTHGRPQAEGSATAVPADYLLDFAWGIIANAGGGDWNNETCEWREAAVKWRDQWEATLPGPGRPHADAEFVARRGPAPAGFPARSLEDEQRASQRLGPQAGGVSAPPVIHPAPALGGQEAGTFSAPEAQGGARLCGICGHTWNEHGVTSHCLPNDDSNCPCARFVGPSMSGEGQNHAQSGAQPSPAHTKSERLDTCCICGRFLTSQGTCPAPVHHEPRRPPGEPTK